MRKLKLVLNLRLSKEDLALINRNADKVGLTRSEYIRQLVLMDNPDNPLHPSDSKFDKTAYQREYMRERRKALRKINSRNVQAVD